MVAKKMVVSQPEEGALSANAMANANFAGDTFPCVKRVTNRTPKTMAFYDIIIPNAMGGLSPVALAGNVGVSHLNNSIEIEFTDEDMFARFISDCEAFASLGGFSDAVLIESIEKNQAVSSVVTADDDSAQKTTKVVK